jgi:glycosyltransferase involved in cell wall biosynthesis
VDNDSLLVSICIPAYNYPDLLRQCLKSIVNQTYTNYEVIITDDSAHNELEGIVEEFDNINIKYTKNKVAKGSPANWNECIKLASGNLIKILHHDDTFSSKNSLEEFVRAFDNNPNTHFVFSQCYNVTGAHSTLFKNFGMVAKLRNSPHLLFFANIIGAPSVTMFSRKAISLMLFDESTKWYVDIIYYVELLNRFKTFTYIEKPLICITAGSDLQVTNTTNGIDKVVEIIYTFYKLELFNLSKYKIISTIYFLELFKRYRITKLMLHKKDIQSVNKFSLPFFLAQMPINYRVYSVIRILYLKLFFK